MSQPRPSFIDSPYFIMKDDNWHLTDDAPEELKKEFEEYMQGGTKVIDLSKYDEYLIAGKEGLDIKNNCPQNIKTELIEIDKEYYTVYGEHLIKVECDYEESGVNPCPK